MMRLVKLLVVTGLGAVAGIGLGFALFLNQIPEQEVLPDRPAAAVVALTGGPERIADAIDLMERGYAGRLLISGVNPSLTRADVIRMAPRHRKLIECCVDLGYEARNTIGNAREARQWMKDHELRGAVIVVTANFHMPRALLEMSRAMPGTELLPFPVVTERSREGTWWRDPAMARLWGLEYVKYVVALLRRSVEQAFSSGSA
jgi:uncharacterized SAM-binding protein YcdF (DUF218 family)